MGADPEDTDGGYESDGAVRADDATAGSPKYRGSAMCAAPLDGSTCFPDESPLVGQCPPRAPATDAGVAGDGGTVPQGGVSCHVVNVKDSTGSSTTPTPTCLVAGPGHDGDQCLQPTDCAAGFECVGSPGQCRHYCCDGTCGKAQFCDIQTVAVGGVKAPVCAPVRSCKLLSPMGCSEGETCAIVNDDDGTTSCVATGPALVTQDCEAVHCAKNLTCLGTPGSRRCYQLCEKTANTACTVAGEKCKGNAPLFKDANTGVCQK